MPHQSHSARRHGRALCPLLMLLALFHSGSAPAAQVPSRPLPADPFAGFTLPDDWEAKFWDSAEVKALVAMEPKAVAALVPVQAGLRYCRCAACGASDQDEPLTWSVLKPAVVTCRKCGVDLPNDQYPAKVPLPPPLPPGVPEESVEVRPKVFHKYPYHQVAAEKQAHPDERLYLAARRDYEAREFLARAALYAAVKYHEQPAGQKDPALARLAAVIVLRFATVYPDYATHFDQPGHPKQLQQANLEPPFRRGYQTAKWDWNGSLDVPLNLLIAYALIRHDPAIAEAGGLLEVPNPARTIEVQLFRASAEFVRRQPQEFAETALYADRGLLAVGRLLDDPALIAEAIRRLDDFVARGFSHDGLWQAGDGAEHQRVLDLMTAWIAPLLPITGEPGRTAGPLGVARSERSDAALPFLALAREASLTLLTDTRPPEVQQVGWPEPGAPSGLNRPGLLGGATLARLSVGSGPEALDLELRGQGALGNGQSHRLTLRVAVGGRTVLGDLSGVPATDRGWERSTASQNAVLIDGLNHGERLPEARSEPRGSDVRFFAADPDFQVATLDDRYAYPNVARRFRHTLIACSGPKARYAVSVVEVRGGLQHDQLFHGSPGTSARWSLPVESRPGPATLLPHAIPFVPNARAEEGRWFVQSYGEFDGLTTAPLERPTQAVLAGEDGRGVRLHVLGNLPLWAITGTTPDPIAPTPADPREPAGRPVLLLRRRSSEGGVLASTFVTLIEPTGTGGGLKRVGRLEGEDGSVVLRVETEAGTETLFVNPTPGTPRWFELADGRQLHTDGLVVRLRGTDLMLAGGTFASIGGRGVSQARIEGTIEAVSPPGALAGGWFETKEPVDDPGQLVGQALLIRHGDGTSRGWTITGVENLPSGRARIAVHELAGFSIDPASGAALYRQFPPMQAPGPHKYTVCRIARSSPSGPHP